MAQQNESKATDSDAQQPGASESLRALLARILDQKKVAPKWRRRTAHARATGRAMPASTTQRTRTSRWTTMTTTIPRPTLTAAARKPSRQSTAAANGDGPLRGSGSRKLGLDDGKSAGSSQNGSREQSSSNGGGGGGGGSSTAASQPAQASVALQPSSRKRKATTTQSATASSMSSPAVMSTKRIGNAMQVTGPPLRETNLMTFEHSNARPENGRMKADDGTVLEPNDHVYLVCEPPGEPYYLGRIMEFLHAGNDTSRPVDAVRINWFYRPKDIGRKAVDTRQVFATMHSDISPLTALRGKCRIMHRGEIDSMDQFRKTPDSFWYEKLYDRYIQKNYDLIPTASIVNVPDKVKKVLDERWKFVLVEQGRGKELTSAVKLCKRCSGYCASNDSVDCAVCHNTYHMNCVRPPLLKKPSRGFAWSCAACSRAQERKLEARNTPSGTDANGDLEDDELLDDEDEDAQGIETDRTTPADEEHHHQGTAEQIYQASLWPWRYLGMHCKPEDALDYDDRIYPRASTRIGPRHQANVTPWPGRPVEYVKPLEVRRGPRGPKISKEALDAEKALRGKRPKWVQDQPPGYVARGEDHDENDPNATSTLLWKPPTQDKISDEDVKDYMKKAQVFAKKLGLPERSTNLQDIALETLFQHDYDPSTALQDLPDTEQGVFKEPLLTPAEQKKFEEGVAKYGSELHLVMKHVKTMTPGEVVRYYYTWKKTERGQQVWGSFAGRKGKKHARRAEEAANKLADDVADHEDDSAFDTAKAAEKKRSFICQFCSTTTSRQWRRAPNASSGLVGDNANKGNGKDKGNQYVTALCRRCAELWRRYGIRFEEMEEVAKKVAQSGGRAWKRKQDEELLKELQAAQEMGLMTPDRDVTPMSGSLNAGQEPPRKKLKGAPGPADKDQDSAYSDGGGVPGSGLSKKKDKYTESTPIPEMPKPRVLPCAICDQMEPLGEQHISCRECRLTVHRNCYGIMDNRMQGKWICDMCSNDKNPQLSIQYKCVLCPVEHTEQDFVEQPKLTHHKKKMSEKDRERERLEVQQARKAAEYYRKQQEDLNRPVNPREPLKRTADNNWVHVTCAVWTPEVKFGNAKALEPSEGIPSIPRSRYDEVCQACNQQGGRLCLLPPMPYHVECARQQGHLLGFDVSPVKGSRRDQFNVVTLNGETGTMSAVLWCKDHIPTKTIAHHMHEMVTESGLNALQFYVQNYKQADLTLTGTVRKANLMMNAAKVSGVPTQPSGPRRTSIAGTTTTIANGAGPPARNGEPTEAATNALQPGEKVCITCGIDVTPKWWPIDDSQERKLTNGHHGVLGSEARKFVEQRKFQCHQCRKAPRTSKSFVPQHSPPVPEPPRSSHAMPPAPVTAVPPLRSPPAPPSDYRPLRSEIHSLLHHPTPNERPPPPAPVTAAVPQHMDSRPPAVTHPYGAAPHPRSFSEWPHLSRRQHGSPPRHLNGGPPPLHGGPPAPPPLSNLTSLRPPAMTAPPPVAPLSVGHHHAHGSPVYGNGLPRHLGD
ncbi:hypothetical protein ACCO45_001267 [Purpureocillium lilacinum]|uniref:Uncharacterized protein n=1 Tax=Purpureocillium lilacinum TaxID=33203 RepID=A0ACC4E7S6_PURLI